MGLLDFLRPKRHMPLDQFEAAVAAVAAVHLATGRTVDSCATDLAREYRHSYCDAEVHALPGDLASAARLMLKVTPSLLAGANREATPEVQAALFRHFTWYVMHHERDGSPRAQKALNGTAFNQADFMPNRQDLAVTNFVAYATGALQGTRPLAPAGSR